MSGEREGSTEGSTIFCQPATSKASGSGVEALEGREDDILSLAKFEFAARENQETSGIYACAARDEKERDRCPDNKDGVGQGGRRKLLR